MQPDPMPPAASLDPARHRRVSVAPMMGCTDRHDRFLLRLISQHVLLYTEMLTTGALSFGDTAGLLAFDPAEHPVALQLGGSDPAAMARCARMAEAVGYDEVNMNVGCPSPRVRSGAFGACLMAAPQRVADCVRAMRDAVSVPVTVKTRTGIDHRDSFEHLCEFVDTVSRGGCDAFIIHARKAWLSGLSPRQNRSVPPLDYPRVYRLKHIFPALTISINGGVTDLDQVEAHLAHVDGAMMGREAYGNPFVLAGVDRRFFGGGPAARSRQEVLAAYLEYCARQLGAGSRLPRLIKHVTGLFQGQPGARKWRRHLSDHMHRPDAGLDVVRGAARLVSSCHRRTRKYDFPSGLTLEREKCQRL